MLGEIRERLEKALEDAKVVEQIGVLADSILAITGQTFRVLTPFSWQ